MGQLFQKIERMRWRIEFHFDLALLYLELQQTYTLKLRELSRLNQKYTMIMLVNRG